MKDAKNFAFHGDAVAAPSKRQTLYADKRANLAGRTPPGAWTEVGTLCATFAERVEGATQPPVAPVERPLPACTDAGDLVLDPFGEEGTKSIAAARHSHRCVLVEQDQSRSERAERAGMRLLMKGAKWPLPLTSRGEMSANLHDPPVSRI